MAQPAFQTRDPATAEEAAIDRGHLARMTFGDRGLQREVLQLFDRQAVLLIERMRAGAPAAIGPLAHTLKGSAAGIGAGKVAGAAGMAEMAADRSAAECRQAVERLAKAVEEARATIAELLREG